MTHEHTWRQVFEESLIGGYFPIGWECTVCGEFVQQCRVGPGGLDGRALGGGKLIAPLGAHGQCADGSFYKEQIVDGAGNLHIVRPD